MPEEKRKKKDFSEPTVPQKCGVYIILALQGPDPFIAFNDFKANVKLSEFCNNVKEKL